MRNPRYAWIKRYGGTIYFALLFVILLSLYLPTFGNPPRSDYWPVFYVFQKVDASPAPPTWLAIANHDPWGHGTFRPLSHLILYLEHKLFGTNFIGNHITNFFMYCLVILLLARLARSFALDRMLTAAGLTLFTFLYSHFDIISWTFHLSIIIGFAAFLSGFILYIKFIKGGKKIWLVAVGLLFLFAMFSSENYALWPPSLVILTFSRHLFPRPEGERRKQNSSCFLLLGGVYLIYLIGFILTRSVSATTGDLPYHSIDQLLLSVPSTFFNLLYTGILVNLVPVLNVPMTVRDNIDMGGLLLKLDSQLGQIIFLTGGIVLILILLGIRFLYRRNKFSVCALLTFLLFLYFSSFFLVVLGRAGTNKLGYILAQFRYQYVPNAILSLILVAVLDKLVCRRRREKILICFALIPVLSANIFFSRMSIQVIQEQMRPLRIMISRIRQGIEDGVISHQNKLYIEEGITKSLPNLCWNRPMARFFPGTYQWMFARDELWCFTFFIKDAQWIIKADDPTIIRKNREKLE